MSPEFIEGGSKDVDTLDRIDFRRAPTVDVPVPSGKGKKRAVEIGDPDRVTRSKVRRDA